MGVLAFSAGPSKSNLGGRWDGERGREGAGGVTCSSSCTDSSPAGNSLSICSSENSFSPSPARERETEERGGKNPRETGQHQRGGRSAHGGGERERKRVERGEEVRVSMMP